MLINEIPVLMERPSLCFEEIEQKDGTLKVGQQDWLPLVICCYSNKDRVLSLPDTVELKLKDEKWIAQGCKFQALDGPFVLFQYDEVQYHPGQLKPFPII